MELNRLNPVTLIAGAVSRFGAGAARQLASRSQGGLLLADADEQALLTLADELEAQKVAPERVSTLAFDASDPTRWAKASAFIAEQYGRLDWAVINAPRAPLPELVDFRPSDRVDFAALALSLRKLTALMRKNTQGGAIAIGVDAQALAVADERGHAAEMLEIVAATGRDSNVRVNLIVLGGAQDAPWAEAPLLPDLQQSARGALKEALDELMQSDGKTARCASNTPLARVLAILLTDEPAINGATIAMDAEQPM
ncbi:MAG: SDR family NAD(P)-dependent oxidoreductase [Hyphomonadaceae bacterium]|nr:SDR family NAD(P)-dependent oxidoreductase [Hyphomonadaceae bacterium]